MFEKTDTKITRYVDGPWFIDVVRGFSEGIYLGHEGYGVVKFLFGMEPGFTDEQFFRYIYPELEFHKSAYEAEFFDPELDEEEQEAFDKFTEEEYIKHLWSEETQEVFDQFTEEEQRQNRMRFNDDDDLPFY